MSLASSLNVGVSALRAYSEGIQVVSNNIANVNTVGYKASHAQYADTFSNILRPLVPNENNTAVKIAPTQVGGGVQIESVSPVFSQGTIQITNSNSDLAIAGNGFFRVKNPQTGQYFVTRAGNFRVDADGYMVTQQGFRVQGSFGAKTKVVYDASDKSYDVKGQQDNAKVTVPTGISTLVKQGSVTLGNYDFNVETAAGLSVGMPISGTGIATGAKITKINGLIITMDKAGTATTASSTTTAITAGLKTVDSGSLTLVFPADYTRENLAKGMVITGAGLPSGTTVETFSGNIKKTIPASATSLTLSGVGATSGTTTLSATSTEGLAPGMILSAGSSIPSGARVVSVDTDGIHFDIDIATTAAASGLSVVAAGSKTLDSSVNLIKLPDVSNLEVGMRISGAGIPSGSFIGSISGVANVDGTKDVTLLDAPPQSLSSTWITGASSLDVGDTSKLRLGDTLSIGQTLTANTGITTNALTLDASVPTANVGDVVTFERTFVPASASTASGVTTVDLGVSSSALDIGDVISWGGTYTGVVTSRSGTSFTMKDVSTVALTALGTTTPATVTWAGSATVTGAGDFAGSTTATLDKTVLGSATGSVKVTTTRTITGITDGSSVAIDSALTSAQTAASITSYGVAKYPTGNSYSAVELAFGDQTVVISSRPTVDSFDDVTFSLGTNYTPASTVGDVKISFNEFENFEYYGIDGSLLTGIPLKAAEAGGPKIRTFNVGTSGDINIILSNGQTFTAGAVLLQSFKDPGALTREGDNLFSGISTAGPYNGLFSDDNIASLTPSNGGLGSINGGALELSNVDLGEEFSTMITTQRAFQAGSRVITTTDQMLEEAVNLKR